MMDRRAAMAVLDAAANNKGNARIAGVGERYVFRVYEPLGVFYQFFVREGAYTKWMDADGNERVEKGFRP